MTYPKSAIFSVSLCAIFLFCGYPQLTHAATSLSTFTEFTGEAASDQAGVSVSSAGDIDGDGYGDFIVGALGNSDAGSNAGAAYIVYGSADLFTDTINLSTAAEFTGESVSDFTGEVVSGAGDVNGDGYDDFVIVTKNDDDAGTDAGAIYFVYGSATRYTGTQSLGGYAKFTAEAASDAAGSSVSAVGDVNGDGYDDVLVGAWLNDDGASMAGSTYLIYGSATPYSGTQSLGDFAEFTGVGFFALSGQSVSGAGDVNNDGYDDFLIGAYRNNTDSAGAAYLVYGKSDLYTGTESVADFASFTGETSTDSAGQEVASAGDLDGDGYDDFLISSQHNDDGATNAGAEYIVYGSADLFTGSNSLADFAEITAEAVEARFGFYGGMSSAGDVNGDGYNDVILGLSNDDTSFADAGSAYLLYGSLTRYSGTTVLSAYTQFTGEVAGDSAGYSVAAGDVNGDGFTDILVGAYGNDDGGDTAGAVYLGYLNVDADHDGVTGESGIFDGTDCNDADVSIFANQTYYADSDGDGYGDSDVATGFCSVTAPEGYATDATDCSDADSSVFTEITYYEDTDGDGDGSTATASLCASSAPAGYSTIATDCNDSDAAVALIQTYYEDLDGDGFGDPGHVVTSCSVAPIAGYVANSSDDDDTTFGDVSTVFVNDDGMILITYASTATQIVDPFTSISSKLHVVISTDLRRVVVTNGKFVKVYRDGVLTDSKRVNKKIPGYKLMHLKVKTLYSAYDTVVFASERKHKGKLVVFRLNSSDELKKKVIKTVDLLRKAHKPVLVKFTVSTHHIRVQFDSMQNRVRATYKLTKKGALNAL